MLVMFALFFCASLLFTFYTFLILDEDSSNLSHRPVYTIMFAIIFIIFSWIGIFVPYKTTTVIPAYNVITFNAGGVTNVNSLFVSPAYNTTVVTNAPLSGGETWTYTFFTMIWIVLHLILLVLYITNAKMIEDWFGLKGKF